MQLLQAVMVRPLNYTSRAEWEWNLGFALDRDLSFETYMGNFYTHFTTEWNLRNSVVYCMILPYHNVTIGKPILFIVSLILIVLGLTVIIIGPTLILINVDLVLLAFFPDRDPIILAIHRL